MVLRINVFLMEIDWQFDLLRSLACNRLIYE